MSFFKKIQKKYEMQGQHEVNSDVLQNWDVTDSEKRAAVNTLQSALLHLDIHVLKPLSKLAKQDEVISRNVFIDNVDEIKRKIAGEAVKMHRLLNGLEKSLRAKRG